VNPIVAWVIAESPVDNGAYQAHLTLALYADTDAHVRAAQTELARAARVSVDTMRRGVRALIDAGLVEVVEQPVKARPALLRLIGAPTECAKPPRGAGARRKKPPRGAGPMLPLAPRGAGATDATHASAPFLEQLQPNADALGSADAEPTARGITARVWKLRSHPPAQHFVAVMNIAQALLDAGWPAGEVERVMTIVPTISTRVCELELNRKLPPSNRLVDADRDGASGRITL
jgi:hypothetical protein